jgi:hypothetical protein
MSVPALGVPDINKPFDLYVHKKQLITDSILIQQVGPPEKSGGLFL